MATNHFEKRILKDHNGFYNVQIRSVPVENWKQNDGWGTVYTTSVYEHAVDRLSKEPGAEVEQ